MLTKGIIQNEFAEVVGDYWFDTTIGTICFSWCGHLYTGYTDEGLCMQARRLEYTLHDKTGHIYG